MYFRSIYEKKYICTLKISYLISEVYLYTGVRCINFTLESLKWLENEDVTCYIFIIETLQKSGGTMKYGEIRDRGYNGHNKRQNEDKQNKNTNSENYSFDRSDMAY